MLGAKTRQHAVRVRTAQATSLRNSDNELWGFGMETLKHVHAHCFFHLPAQ